MTNESEQAQTLTEHFNETAPGDQAAETQAASGAGSAPEISASTAASIEQAPAESQRQDAFNDASHANAIAASESNTALEAENEVRRAALENDLAQYNAERHYKPDDKKLVKEVDRTIDDEARSKYASDLNHEEGLDFEY